ncbi:hypothetical protein [Paraferrimonas sp. SM1919]|uniref:hypothetical protein n=1 Tax=Paraferrimonas sp. SM1919 TaxID=2662263 RepID=UPI0013D76278|nr:hypothetical protein [Paraferrimonas sp. SM1919]
MFTKTIQKSLIANDCVAAELENILALIEDDLLKEQVCAVMHICQFYGHRLQIWTEIQTNTILIGKFSEAQPQVWMSIEMMTSSPKYVLATFFQPLLDELAVEGGIEHKQQDLATYYGFHNPLTLPNSSLPSYQLNGEFVENVFEIAKRKEFFAQIIMQAS